MSKINFKQVAAAALARADDVLTHWMPGGKRQGPEYLARNPRRDDNSAGSFSVNLITGAWADFATDDRGGDFVALVAYLEGCTQGEAVKRLAAFLGSPDPSPAPKRNHAKAAASDPGPILPIPAQAGPPPTIHPRHGKASAVWVYRDAEGRALVHVCRFDPSGQRKQICPLTWWRDGWHWRSISTPRPLYRLDAIAARPKAVVLVCEGEKAADAAAQLFPDATTTTAMNGAQAPDKADWTPLQGRHVWVWPDHDEPGQRYAKRVAGLVRAAGALSVNVLDLAALAVDPSTRAPRALPEGWDAADALAEGWTAQRITAIHEAGNLFKKDAPPREHAKDADSLPRFEVRDDGVYHLGVSYSRTKRAYEPDAPLWLCSPLKVPACTRDDDSENWGRLLEFRDLDGKLHNWAMPMSMLAGGGDELRSELLRKGLRISPDQTARRRLTDYITHARPERHARCVTRTGWHNGAGVFVFPHRTVGDGAEAVLYQADSLEGNPYRERGTLEEWRDNVAAPCVDNSRLTFAVSCAFAAALLGPVEEDGGGFHLRGDSSGGKTTALRVAASVWGGADYLQRWRATDNGLEALAALHSDTLLVLDELGQMEPRAVGEAAYMLANGSGKSRADRNGNSRARKTWRLLFLSAGEISLAEHMAQVGKRAQAGQEIRMADIPADAGVGLGVFENLHGRKDGHSFSRDLCEAVIRCYGAAGPAFIERVIEHGGALPDLIRKLRDDFMHEVLPADAGGQARRAAARFGLVAAAGELATHYGITPWSLDEARAAARKCFKDWLTCRGGAGNAEVTSLLRQVRQFYETHGESRFSPWQRALDDHAPRTSNRAGFMRKDVTADAVTYYVLPEVFRYEVCAGFDYRDAERILVARRWLSQDSEGRATRKERLPGYGKAVRCYVMPLADMETDSE